MRLSGTVIEIWRLKVHVHKQKNKQTHETTDRTTILFISSNVHYVHLAEIIKQLQTIAVDSVHCFSHSKAWRYILAKRLYFI